MPTESKDPTPSSKAKSRKGKKKEPFDPEGLIGKTIAGRYIMEGCIGRGGMGVVYLARQDKLNRKVVVKLLRNNLVENEEALARFEREAQGLSALQHPNIVTIHDFGHDDERAYLVMEHVDGETISQDMRRKGPMRMNRFAAIAAQILEGIGAAHTQGLLHRDIKPANIMLTNRGEHGDFIKILDFGLAKLNSGEDNVTKEQTLVGSAAFLSPEQIIGLDIDERVDVYALGVLFYFMLSGKRPFEAPHDTAMLYKHVHEAPRPLEEMLPGDHDIPPSVIALIHQCLSKSPEHRPRDANEFLEILTQQITGNSQISLAWSRTEITAPTPSLATPMALPSESPSAPLGHMGQSLSFVRAADGSIQVVAQDGPSGVFHGNSFVLAGAPKRSIWPPIIVGALLVSVLVIGAIFLMNKGVQNSPDEALSPAKSETLNAVPSFKEAKEDPKVALEKERSMLVSELDKIEGKVKIKLLGEASAMLGLLDSQVLAKHPELKERTALIQVQIEVNQLLAKGILKEEKGQLVEAIDIYEEVLLKTPGHLIAQEKISSLREQQRIASIGELSILVTPKSATIKVDDEEMPNDKMQRLVEGVYPFEVTAKGFISQKGEFEIKGGQLYKLEIVLKKKRRSGGRKHSGGGLLPVGSGDSGGLLLPP